MYREGESLASSLGNIIEALKNAGLFFEIILIVDRVPDDTTEDVARKVESAYPEVRLLIREGRQGVGTAIRTGISMASGDIVMPVMGDAAESVGDIVAVARKAQEGYDIVVGNRFMKKAMIVGYPPLKYCANRLCNALIRLIFRVPTSDITNAFKAYSVRALRNLGLESRGYSIFLELPVRAYLKGDKSLVELPVTHNSTRKQHGLRILGDGTSYFLIMLKILLRP